MEGVLGGEGAVAVDEVVVKAALDAAADTQLFADVEHMLQPHLQADQLVVGADGGVIANGAGAEPWQRS